MKSFSERVLEGSEVSVEVGPCEREGGEDRRVGLQLVEGLLEVLFLLVCAFQSRRDRFQCLHAKHDFPGETGIHSVSSIEEEKAKLHGEERNAIAVFLRKCCFKAIDWFQKARFYTASNS